MRRRAASLLFAATLTVSGFATADMYPYVLKGPVITGVGQNDAWVAWYTAHHQGESSFMNECYNDALTGSPNDTIPTLTLTSGGKYADSTCDRYHKVHLTGLAPNTEYSFSLDMPNADGTPALGRFGTAPAPGDTTGFKFLIYGDDRDNPVTSASTRPDHEALVAAMLAQDGDAAFLMNVGDYALNYPAVSGDDRGYAEFFDVERELLASRSIAPVFGNHESIDTTFFDGLLSAPTFAGAPHPYYFSFDWGRLHIACLNSFEGPTDILLGGARQPALSDAQAQWLDADLGAAKSAGKLLLILIHQGAFSHGIGDTPHGGLPDVQAKVVPLMLKHGVLGVFAGHDHYYQRGHEGCTDYVVTGAGGAEMYEPDPSAPGVVTTFQDVSYVAVSVDPSGVVMAEAKDALGNVFDQWVMREATCSPGDPDAGLPDAAGDTGVAADASDDHAEADGAAPDGSAAGDSATPEQDTGAAGATSAGAGDDRSADAGSDGGCACSSSSPRSYDHAVWLALAGLAAMALRRARRP